MGTERCAICLENIGEEGVMTRCGHQYHNECVDRWQQTRPQNGCPMCRQPLVVEDNMDIVYQLLALLAFFFMDYLQFFLYLALDFLQILVEILVKFVLQTLLRLFIQGLLQGLVHGLRRGFPREFLTFSPFPPLNLV